MDLSSFIKLFCSSLPKIMRCSVPFVATWCYIWDKYIYRQYIGNISAILAMNISFQNISAIYRDWLHSLGTRSAVKILKVFTTSAQECTTSGRQKRKRTGILRAWHGTAVLSIVRQKLTNCSSTILKQMTMGTNRIYQKRRKFNILWIFQIIFWHKFTFFLNILLWIHFLLDCR